MGLHDPRNPRNPHNSVLAVCSWSLQPHEPVHLAELIHRTGLRHVQLALSPMIENSPRWGGVIDELRSHAITIVSGMMATIGEDYSTLDTIARTGGIRPDETWAANREHAQWVVKIASRAGLDLVSFHAGFIPEEPGDPERTKLIARLREIADLFSAGGVHIALETGQESAETLLDALTELNHPNVGINFDPANMILYDKGDPVEALRLLGPHVAQIHIKDALPTTTPGSWGSEVPVGTGAVDWDAFFEIAFALTPAVNLIIEREAGDDRINDISIARTLVEGYLSC